MKSALIVLAPGFEEGEAVMTVDLLRRAGVTVTLAGLEGLMVSGARGMKLAADVELERAGGPFDAVVLPGGMPGAKNLVASGAVLALIRRQLSEGRFVAAICAAPALVLGAHGFLKDKSFTCFPGMEGEVKGGLWKDQKVVRDDNIITSQGLGTAADFGFELIRALIGGEKAKEVATRAVFFT